MNYRKTTILAETALSGSGTKAIDINIKDIISRITIGYYTTKAQNYMDLYAHADITKVELVDGSEVLHSLNGGENQALCIYDRKCRSMNEGYHVSGNPDYSTYGIDFGRFLYDPLLALDPSRFRNLQLKISYNVALSDTAASAGALEVWADVFEEKVVSPVGFLMAKEHESWTLGTANAYHYVDLPTDYLLRKLLVQGYLKDYNPDYQVGEVRLDEDNEKRIVFDLGMEDYLRAMRGVWTPVEETLQMYVHTGADHIQYVTPTDYTLAVSGVGNGGDAAIYAPAQVSGGKVDLRCTDSRFFKGLVQGGLPNHCFEFPFGNPQDLDDWYDVTRLGRLRLRLREGSGTSGSANTILQQLRRY